AALTRAEAAGLVEVRTRVRFRHPLLRSAVYQAAVGADRSQVHGALAAATDPTAEPDHHSWHRALATTGPDEEVARDLERSAARARARGGIVAAAAFLRRAVELTPGAAQRGKRAVDAAYAMVEAADLEVAADLLAVAEMGPLDDLRRARAARLHALIGAERRRGTEAPMLLLEAARRLQPLDATLARDTYLDALGATCAVGRLAVPGIRERIAQAARTVPASPGPPRPEDLLLEGLTLWFTEGHAAAVPSVRRALEGFRRGVGQRDPSVLPRMWLAWMLAGDVWDDQMSDALAQGASRLVRESGLLVGVPVALVYEALGLVDTGELSMAAALVEGSPLMAAETGGALFGYCALSLAAWRGDQAQVEALARTSISEARTRGEGMMIGFAEYAVAVVHNGHGRTGPALSAARRACEHDDLFVYVRALPELVEAGARQGNRAEAGQALEVLTDRARACGADHGLGVVARSRALLQDGSAAQSAYEEAVERLGRTRKRVDLARAHLVYGEWLRRENRRTAARGQLRRAHEMFDSFGAVAFAERARRELAAAGETVRARGAEAADVLTAQESQIARLASEGGTNPEIGAQLFISPRTVEYHLGKVFSKLGIGSRRQLRGALARRVAPTRS
ncbi:MAG: LuxR C-terminal-related transcriptional regulator, partial [Phycicoccus sp.]